jgi:hypothetical protein
MKTYLFLLAWVDGSEGAGGDDTNVDDQDDLLPEYNKGSEHVFALYIAAPNETIARDVGYSRAFHDNYTGYNTVSICFSVECIEQNNNQNTPLIVVDLQED